jgi:prepilin-type N-terminal cleavage/methylation domain-containing protein
VKRRIAQPARRGFTMLELAVVLLVMSVVAVSVLPAVGLLDASRRSAAGDELARVLEDARERARASGRPFGVEIDAVNERVRTLTIETSGSAPTSMRDPLGAEESWTVLSRRYPGAAIVTFSNGRDGGGTVVWFSSSGVPEIRSSGGALVGEFTRDAVIQMNDGRTLRVTRNTGSIVR